MDPSLWLLPPVGAFIGWVTNIIAIRMLFYPKQPVRIPFTSLTLQGVLPRRHADLAASVGRAVSEELVSVAELMSRLDIGAIKGQLAAAVSSHVERKLDAGVSRLLPRNWRDSLVAYLRDVIDRETDEVLDDVLAQFGSWASQQIDVEALVTEKVAQLDLDELEALIVRLAGKELKAVIVMGAVFGFLIGLIQMVFVALLGAA